MIWSRPGRNALLYSGRRSGTVMFKSVCRQGMSRRGTGSDRSGFEATGVWDGRECNSTSKESSTKTRRWTDYWNHSVGTISLNPALRWVAPSSENGCNGLVIHMANRSPGDRHAGERLLGVPAGARDSSRTAWLPSGDRAIRF
jgi:hypothetical protein